MQPHPGKQSTESDFKHNPKTIKVINSMIVYDFELLKASIVMADMKQKSKQENIVFRFLLKNSKFIIGSDSATNRGEVLHF